jgi:hypothetical protein
VLTVAAPAPFPAPAPLPAASAPAAASPAGNPFSFDEQSTDSDDSQRPRKSGRPWRKAEDRDDRDDCDDDRDWSPRRSARGKWGVFADGCALAKWGALVEIIGVGYLFLIFELTLLDTGVGRSVAEAGPAIGLPFLLCLLAGTGMMGVAKVRMMSVPPDSGAGGVIAGSAGLTGLRFILLLAATILFVSAMSGRRNVEGGQSILYAIGALLGSWALGTLAEFTVVPGISAVGGAIPDKSIRVQAASTGIMFQIQGLVIIMIMMIGFFSDVAGIIDRPLSPSRATKTALVWLVLFVIQVWYTYAQFTLYATAARAGRSGRRDA